MGGRGLEILKPRRDERDFLVVDRLDEVGLRARISQAVLIPMMNGSCKKHQITLLSSIQSYLLGISLKGRIVVSVRL